MQFIVIGLDLCGRPNPAVPRTLSALGAVEVTSGVWIVHTCQTAAEIGEALAVHVAPDQKLKVLETVHGGWGSILKEFQSSPPKGK